MPRISVNRHVLENVLLKELKQSRGCAGAEAVIVCGLRERSSVPGNWKVSTFDSGTSDGTACKEALASIYARAVPQYELVGL
jgi:hypothetical protein